MLIVLKDKPRSAWEAWVHVEREPVADSCLEMLTTGAGAVYRAGIADEKEWDDGKRRVRNVRKGVQDGTGQNRGCVENRDARRLREHGAGDSRRRDGTGRGGGPAASGGDDQAVCAGGVERGLFADSGAVGPAAVVAAVPGEELNNDGA